MSRATTAFCLRPRVLSGFSRTNDGEDHMALHVRLHGDAEVRRRHGSRAGKYFWLYSRDGSSWKLARMIVSLDDLPEDEDGDVEWVRPNKSADAPGNFAVSPGGSRFTSIHCRCAHRRN